MSEDPKRKKKKRFDSFGAEYFGESYYCGERDLPYLECHSEVLPSFLALYSEPGLYRAAERTGVCFYQDDFKFDSIGSLADAILHNDAKLLNEYKKRFEGVDFVITPDYSTYGDMPDFMVAWNIGRSRLVGIWFIMEIGAVVIPNVTYANESSFSYCLDGIEVGSVVAMSAKGMLAKKENLELLRFAIRQVVDRLKPKTIVVYSVADDKTTLAAFEYAIQQGVEIVIPDNTLKRRNRILKGDDNNGKK